MAQARDALAGYPDLVKVNYSAGNPDLISPIGKDFAPGIDDQRVTIACATAIDFANGAWSNNESTIFYCARSIEYVPMGLSGLLCKGSRDKKDFGT